MSLKHNLIIAGIGVIILNPYFRRDVSTFFSKAVSITIKLVMKIRRTTLKPTVHKFQLE
jgi:hypothetical protein